GDRAVGGEGDRLLPAAPARRGGDQGVPALVGRERDPPLDGFHREAIAADPQAGGRRDRRGDHHRERRQGGPEGPGALVRLLLTLDLVGRGGGRLGRRVHRPGARHFAGALVALGQHQLGAHAGGRELDDLL